MVYDIQNCELQTSLQSVIAVWLGLGIYARDSVLQVLGAGYDLAPRN